MIPRLIPEPEAARLIGVSTNTLRGVRARGEINFRRVGKRVRYTEEDLRDYVGVRCNDSRSETTGSPSGPEASSGVERGSIVQLDKHVASQLAQQTFGKRK